MPATALINATGSDSEALLSCGQLADKYIEASGKGGKIMHLDFVSGLWSGASIPFDDKSSLEAGQVLPAKLIPSDQDRGSVPMMQLARCADFVSGTQPLEAGLLKLLLRWYLPLDQKLIQEFTSVGNDLPVKKRAAHLISRAFVHSLDIKGPEQKKAVLDYILRHSQAVPQGQKKLNQSQPLYPEQEILRALSLLAGQSEGEIYLIYPGRSRKRHPEKRWPHRLVVCLSTSGWGEIWIQLIMHNSNLTAQIWAENSSFLRLAKVAEQALRRRVSTLGWELAPIKTANKKITGIAELIEPLGLDNYQHLDILA